MAKRTGKIMQIFCSPLYEKQLKETLESILHEDMKSAKDFKLYLDTIIMNAYTKFKKYKKSIYFENEAIKDIEYEAFTIPIFYDEAMDRYIVLGLVKK